MRPAAGPRRDREDAAGWRQCDHTRPPLDLLPDESWPREGFIPAETLVQNGTAGDNGTAGGTLHLPVLGFLVG